MTSKSITHSVSIRLATQSTLSALQQRERQSRVTEASWCVWHHSGLRPLPTNTLLLLLHATHTTVGKHHISEKESSTLLPNVICPVILNESASPGISSSSPCRMRAACGRVLSATSMLHECEHVIVLALYSNNRGTMHGIYNWTLTGVVSQQSCSRLWNASGKYSAGIEE